MVKSPPVEKKDDARAALLAAAWKAFAEGGQAAVAVIPVCQAAGLTTGALYHHFENRQGLLRALVEDVAAWVAVQASAAMEGEADDWKRLRAGVSAVLDACLEPVVRNAYNEAPSIVGLEEWRAIEEGKTGVLLVETLRKLEARGALKPVSIPLLASMVKGAIIEGAMSITRSKTPKKTRKEAGELLDAMLAALAT